MKYVIGNTQLFNLIYDYIDNILRVEGKIKDNIGYDYTRGEETWDLVWFQIDEDMEFSDDWIFEYTKDTWYTRKFNGKTREQDEFTNIWSPKTPLLSFNSDSSVRRRFDTMFNDLWHSVFEHWFTDSFPNYPVKTFLFN